MAQSLPGTQTFKMIRTFTESFRTLELEKSIKVILYDLGFYFLLVAGFIFFVKTIEFFNYPLSMMASSPTGQADLMDPLKVDILYSTFVSFMYKTLAAITVFIVFGSFVTGLFKGFIWDTERGNSLSLKSAWEYSLITFFWIIFNCVAFFLIILIANPFAGAILVFIQIFLFIHILMHIFLVKSKGKSKRKAFKKGIKNSFRPRLILPYVTIFVLYMVIFAGILRWPMQLLPYMFAVVISWILTVIYLAWARHYIMLVMR